MATGLERDAAVFRGRTAEDCGERGTVYHMDTSMYGVCMHDMDRAQTKLLYDAIRAMAYRGFDIGDKHVTCRVLGSAAILAMHMER